MRRVLLIFSFALVLPAGARAQADENGAVCLTCHDDIGEQIAKEGNTHGILDCLDCHVDRAGFDEEEGMHVEAPQPAACGACHEEEDEKIGGGVHAPPGGPGCSGCHGQHWIPEAATAGERGSCLRCHVVPESGHPPVRSQQSCLDCHGSHDDLLHEGALADERCLDCHGDERVEGVGSPEEALASPHGQAGLRCILCHRMAVPAEGDERPCSTATAVDCSRCHAAAAASWRQGVHSRIGPDEEPAATCRDCHGGHRIEALDVPARVPDVCERCHGTRSGDAAAGLHAIPVTGPAFERSAHAWGLRRDGLAVSATCVSCHGGHPVLPAEDPGSRTNRAAIPYTCGQCHSGLLRDFLDGVHGKAFLRGIAEVPVCTDCHGEHDIEGPSEATSPVAAGRVAGTCGHCHGNDEMARRFGLPPGRLSSWGRSYHGVASSLGEPGAANCSTCHGHHAIYPSSDPRSAIYPANLAATCGGCHPGAGEAFASIPVHSEIDRATNYVPWLVRSAYLVVIRVVIGAFVLFILLDLAGWARERLRIGPPSPPPVDPAEWPDEDRLVSPGESFPRLSRLFRAQHAVLLLSFTILVLTGLPLFLHDLPWLRGVFSIRGSYELRSLLHRAAALGLIGLSVWHMATGFLRHGARSWLASMWIRVADVRGFVQQTFFRLGLAEHPPQPGRYTLVEKLEYWAVVWGNTVMIATGTVLWRPDWFLGSLPSWAFDLCRVLHGFEATLAFLAILIWHMYHVHLRPGVFPMSRVWITGRIGREELRHHHTAEYLEILRVRRAMRASLGPEGGSQQPHQQDDGHATAKPQR